MRFPRRGQNDEYGAEDPSSSDESDEVDKEMKQKQDEDQTQDPLKCCICHKELISSGYSAFPLVPYTDMKSKCCNRCKHEYVIPARIADKRKDEMYLRRKDIQLREEVNTIFDRIFNVEKQP